MASFLSALILVLMAVCSAYISSAHVGALSTRVPFHYQLQGATYAAIRQLRPSYVVVDPDDVHLSTVELVQLRRMGINVLAYLSIGEAEVYRSYWLPSWRVGEPSFIDAENPDWQGNFNVRFWDDEWQTMTHRRLSALITMGYAGAYLDVVDAYVYWHDRGIDDADQRMMTFVEDLAAVAYRTSPHFRIIPQNAVALTDDATYRLAIDGIGVESMWYVGDAVQSVTHTADVLTYVARIRHEKKPVFAIDYPISDRHVCDFYTRCRAAGLICVVTSRALDRDRPRACR